MNLHTVSVGQFRKMLLNARTWLDKAAAHAEQKKFDSKLFLSFRIAPDMFALGKQLQVATDHAKGFTARVAGVDLPKYEDNESTIAELQARIDKTVAFMDSIKPEQIEANAGKEIVYMVGTNERRFPSSEQYLLQSAMGNFWFHITMTYAILRHNGVDVGKLDYLQGHKG
jgi:uncharacterized protein